MGRNEDGTWLQLCCVSGESVWVQAESVEVTGELESVPAVALGSSADAATPENGITFPAPGDVVSGTVTIQGMAMVDNFARYELDYKSQERGDDAYTFFADGTQPVQNGTLGTWDARGFTLGDYTLRLRVVQADGNYGEYFVGDIMIMQVQN